MFIASLVFDILRVSVSFSTYTTGNEYSLSGGNTVDLFDLPSEKGFILSGNNKFGPIFRRGFM